MFKFSQVFLFFVAFVFNSLYSYSYEFKYLKDVEVGNEPVGVFYDYKINGFHVFCKGTDKNFNGKFEPDSGDVVPTWWTLKLDNNGEVESLKKVKDFDFSSIPFPFRPAFSSSDRFIFINHYDGIVKYNLDNFEQVGNKLDFFGINGLDYRSGHLFISQSTYGATIDTIVVYSITQNKVMNKYPVGKNLMLAKIFQPSNPDYKGIAAISVGSFGSDSSALHTSYFAHFEQPKFSDYLIGNTANYIDIADNKFVIVPVMMSNKLILTDLTNATYPFAVPLGEEPSWDGPSFAKFLKIHSNENLTEAEYLIFVTTYLGNFEILKFTYNESPDGSIERTVESLNAIQLVNKGESLDFSAIPDEGSIQIVVANALKPDYSANNTVSLIKIEGIVTSTKEKDTKPNFVLSNENLFFNGYYGFISKFSIFDIYGNMIRNIDNSNTITINNLASGTYIAKFFDGSNSFVYKFNIIK